MCAYFHSFIARLVVLDFGFSNKTTLLSLWGQVDGVFGVTWFRAVLDRAWNLWLNKCCIFCSVPTYQRWMILSVCLCGTMRIDGRWLQGLGEYSLLVERAVVDHRKHCPLGRTKFWPLLANSLCINLIELSSHMTTRMSTFMLLAFLIYFRYGTIFMLWVKYIKVGWFWLCV